MERGGAAALTVMEVVWFMFVVGADPGDRDTLISPCINMKDYKNTDSTKAKV